MTKIGFITDLHIDEDIQKNGGIDTKERFLDILRDACAQKPDLIILGGDLCNVDGTPSVYHWIKRQLLETNLPFHVIPGNHDNSSMMSDIFYASSGSDELYQQINFQGLNITLLDSRLASLSEKQWEWFISVVPQTDLIFIHHPPTIIGSKHMEPAYGFTQVERWKEVLSCSKKQLPVVTGHFHMDACVVVPTFSTYVTPSTYIQIEPHSEALSTLKNIAGYRIIEIRPDNFKTFLRYYVYPK